MSCPRGPAVRRVCVRRGFFAPRPPQQGRQLSGVDHVSSNTLTFGAAEPIGRDHCGLPAEVWQVAHKALGSKNPTIIGWWVVVGDDQDRMPLASQGTKLLLLEHQAGAVTGRLGFAGQGQVDGSSALMLVAGSGSPRMPVWMRVRRPLAPLV